MRSDFSASPTASKLSPLCRHARPAARTPYVTRKAAPIQATTVTAVGIERTTAPRPPTPAAISTASETAQIATIVPTCSRRTPWRRTYAFWAPMATISDRPVPRPAAAAVRAVVMDSMLGTAAYPGQLNFLDYH
ncbi:MAG: hypothetical protein AUG49_17380 [Catenulispora sp. 13_1_20CM_3_70_7]|nr:MAG: hypothetical protein AUG49_17380 [Catenulispora sp. 13_1_20CM_3_70_7]